MSKRFRNTPLLQDNCAAAFVARLPKTVVPRDNRVYLIIAATASELY